MISKMFHGKCSTDFEYQRKAFLESFPSWKTFQCFPDDKTGMTDSQIKYLTRQVSVHEDQYPIDGEIDFVVPFIKPEIILGLEKLNELGAGIYLTINETDGKGRKKENITKVRACFADFDNTPLPAKWPIEPSMIVETSPGKFHAYFLTEDVPLGAFTAIQEGIALRFGSDPVVKDLSRVLRVPGFFHNKKEPFMSRLIHNSGLVYTFGLLTETFPPLKRKQWSAPKYEKAREFSSQDFKGSYGAADGGRNCHIMRRLGGARNRGLTWPEIEAEAWKEAACCNPPLEESEVVLILKSFRKYY